VRLEGRVLSGGMKTAWHGPGLVLLGTALAWPGAAQADMVWPALIVTERLFAFPPIAVGLAVEVVALRIWMEMSWRRAAVAGFAMNAASVLLGLLLVPSSGLLWEVFPGIPLFKLFNIGTFNPGTWVATFVLATLTNAAVEAVVLRWAFGILFSKRLFAVLAAANSASVAVAYASLWLRPAH
jgi:hypothetical protein